MKNIGKTQILICASLLLSAFAIFNTAAAAPPNIADFLRNAPKKAWTTSAADFRENNGGGGMYRWNSNQEQSLHYAANALKGSLYFLDWRITEADFSFKDNQLNSLCLNIYNKSCLTNREFAVNKNTFLAFLDKLRESLNNFYKTGHGKISMTLINRARCQSCVWDTPNAYVVLKWSYDGSNKNNFIAQYATVYIYKDKQTCDETSAAKVASVNPDDLKSRVRTNEAGDRYLPVPMVDQGKRGYCVVACAERILKYFNTNIDQHILAQAAGTSQFGGTRNEDIESSMKRVGVKCNFHVKEILEYSSLMGRNELLKFISKYNRYAKRAGKNKINIYQVKTYNQLFQMMDEDVLIQTRINSDRNGLKKFQAKVKTAIDSGIPVLWGVMLGLVKEGNLPQMAGGHMRLIIGYNPKTDEMIYSDSWGKGHEMKKMTWNKAWAITQMAYIFLPKK